MSFLDRLESRFGRYAIPGLIRYVVALTSLAYILYKLYPPTLDDLRLSPVLVMQGEVWRLVTYIFIPQFGFLMPDWFAAVMYMLFLWWVGNGLEHALGAFKLNVYYFTGMIGITIAAFLFGSGFSAALLNTSLLFAFAQYYPDEVIFIMYIIPAKVKWLAWFTAVLLLYSFVTVPFWSFRVSLVVALANYFLFFGPETLRNVRLRRQVAERRRKFEAAKIPESASLHECAVCHRTEITNPELDFRVARDGQEYCREHLPAKVAPVA